MDENGSAAATRTSSRSQSPEKLVRDASLKAAESIPSAQSPPRNGRRVPSRSRSRTRSQPRDPAIAANGLPIRQPFSKRRRNSNEIQHMPGGAISPLNPSFKTRTGGLTFGRRQRLSDPPAKPDEQETTGPEVDGGGGRPKLPVKTKPGFRRRGSSSQGVETPLSPTEGNVEDLRAMSMKLADAIAKAQDTLESVKTFAFPHRKVVKPRVHFAHSMQSEDGTEGDQSSIASDQGSEPPSSFTRTDSFGSPSSAASPSLPLSASPPPLHRSVTMLAAEEDEEDLPAQSPDPGRSSPLLPPPRSPSPAEQVREIVFPRPNRRKRIPTPVDILEQARNVPLPDSPPPQYDFSNFDGDDDGHLLDGSKAVVPSDSVDLSASWISHGSDTKEPTVEVEEPAPEQVVEVEEPKAAKEPGADMPASEAFPEEPAPADQTPVVPEPPEDEPAPVTAAASEPSSSVTLPSNESVNPLAQSLALALTVPLPGALEDELLTEEELVEKRVTERHDLLLIASAAKLPDDGVHDFPAEEVATPPAHVHWDQVDETKPAPRTAIDLAIAAEVKVVPVLVDRPLALSTTDVGVQFPEASDIEDIPATAIEEATLSDDDEGAESDIEDEDEYYGQSGHLAPPLSRSLPTLRGERSGSSNNTPTTPTSTPSPLPAGKAGYAYPDHPVPRSAIPLVHFAERPTFGMPSTGEGDYGHHPADRFRGPEYGSYSYPYPSYLPQPHTVPYQTQPAYYYAGEADGPDGPARPQMEGQKGKWGRMGAAGFKFSKNRRARRRGRPGGLGHVAGSG